MTELTKRVVRPIWTGEPYPRIWPFKKQMTRDVRHYAHPVEFPFTVGFIARNENNEVLMPDGRWMPSVRFFLKVGSSTLCVIGPHDLEAARGKRFNEAWRNAYVDWRAGR